MTDVKLWLLYSNHLTECKKRVQAHLRTLSAKRVYKSYIHLIYMYKEGLALNNLEWLIWHKTQPNQTSSSEVQACKPQLWVLAYFISIYHWNIILLFILVHRTLYWFRTFLDHCSLYFVQQLQTKERKRKEKHLFWLVSYNPMFSQPIK